jgi:hypothetical protein
MKTLFTLLTLLLLGTQGFGQAKIYKPFPEVYGNWWVRTTHYSMGASGPYQSGMDDKVYFTVGDSVSNGLTYKLVNGIYVGAVTGPIPPTNIFFTGGSHYFSYRNDSLNRKVFIVLSGQTNETLWYDFNLNKGDTVKGYSVNPQSAAKPGCIVIISSIDSVLICNKYHKRFNSISGGPHNSMTEGIGFADQFISTGLNSCFFEPPFTATTIAWSPGTNCQTPLGIKDEEKESQGIRLSPNPADAFLIIETPMLNERAELVLSDLCGRQVVTQALDSMMTRTELRTTGLADGIYLVCFKTSTYSSTRKIIVRHDQGR